MATAQTPVWVGSQDVIETPESPRIDSDATRYAVTRIFEGPFASCLAIQPAQGTTFSDLPPAVQVVGFTIEKMPGAKGRLTIKAETSGPSQQVPFAPTFELEWVEIDKKLEQHPRYGEGGSKSLTEGDLCALQLWENEDDFRLRTYYQFKVASNSGATVPDGYTSSTQANINQVDYDIYTLSSNASDLAYKKMRGEDSYRIWAPVARQTTQSYTLPETGQCGFIETPPPECNVPEGYQWQRSAQRATKTGRYGKWTQQLEWQGADYIDPDIYAQNPAG